MDQNLRGLFEQALDTEPVPPPGDLAGAAMAQGTRLRRRRHLIGGTATAASLAVAAVAAANLTGGPAPAVTTPAGEPAVTCSASSDRWAPRVSIFLRTDVTEAQRAALDAILGGDRRVRDHHYESPQEAFQKFEVLWRDDPKLVESVSPASLPASFRVDLVYPGDYPALRAELDGFGGVADVLGTTC